MQKLAQPSSTMVARDLKDFTVVNGKLYYQGGDGVMAELYLNEAKEELQRSHELS